MSPETLERLVPTGLMGIWREPTTSTSTTASILADVGHLVNTSTTMSFLVYGLSAGCYGTTTTTLSWGWDGDDGTWWVRSTTTSTSTSSQLWPADLVRDEVARQVIHGGQADVLDLARRLLDRQRQHHHRLRLLGDAIEETLQWVHLPLPATPLNGAAMERQVMAVVETQAAFGSSTSATVPDRVASSPILLLRPGLPDTVAQVRRALGEGGGGL